MLNIEREIEFEYCEFALNSIMCVVQSICMLMLAAWDGWHKCLKSKRWHIYIWFTICLNNEYADDDASMLKLKHRCFDI